MKKFLYLLFTFSLGLNVSFIIKKMAVSKKFNAHQSLFLIKDISHKEGFKTYRDKIGSDNIKTNIIYFWDSLNFDQCKSGMRQLDSFASIRGKYSFNYIFATEMEEAAANGFLRRKGIEYKIFKIMGDADDFISGVYNEKPAPSDMYFMGDKQIKPKKFGNKRKGYYLLMDKSGEILYYNYRFVLPLQDPQFINKIKSTNANEKTQIIF